MLTYGVVVDATNEKFKKICVHHLKISNLCIGDNQHENILECQLHINITRGSSRILTSLDYQHYHWKDCSIVWEG
jgi:hypothetical protein